MGLNVCVKYSEVFLFFLWMFFIIKNWLWKYVFILRLFIERKLKNFGMWVVFLLVRVLIVEVVDIVEEFLDLVVVVDVIVVVVVVVFIVLVNDLMYSYVVNV